jgi:tRNA G18 (ribose-2'-O)-methylase SpoU
MSKKASKKSIFLILHNVRSVLNVGSIFRTADAAGVDKIYLCGYTPTPKSHSEKISKTALGAEKYIRWESYKQAGRLLGRLRKEGVSIVALEQTKESKNVFDLRPKCPIALVIGNEVMGLSNGILSYCDICVEIPMYGEKESLNVSVAVGIALYQLRQS